jgi:hypothetical protein
MACNLPGFSLGSRGLTFQLHWSHQLTKSRLTGIAAPHLGQASNKSPVSILVSPASVSVSGKRTS